MYFRPFMPFGFRNGWYGCNNRCVGNCNNCNGSCNCNGCCNCGPGCAPGCGPECGPGCASGCGPECGPGCVPGCGPGCRTGCASRGCRFNRPFCNTPLCPAPFNEADYVVDAIEELLCQYIEVEKKADFNFTSGVVKLNEAIGCIKQGLQCNKEGYVIWCQIEEWLKRYYNRFGVYCGCLEKMECIRECVRKLLLCERTSLEQAITACASLEESRVLDIELQELKIQFKECCVPKC